MFGTALRRTLTAGCVAGLMSVGFAINATSAGAAPNLTADYQFQNSHSSSVGTPPDITDIGAGTNFFTTEVAGGHPATVLDFPQGNGLSLSPTTGLAGSNSYSIVMYFRFADTSGYRRILDFKNGTEDAGLYQLNGILDFYPDAGGSTPTIIAGTYAQVVITDDGGTVTGYVNGQQQFQFDDTANQDATIDANNTLRFFQDNTSGSGTGEDSAGAVARVRLYDGPLSSSDVANLDTIPDTNPACTMGAGVPQPPKPNKNTGLVKFSKALTTVPAVKTTKITISSSLDNCVRFPTSPKAVGPATSGSVKLSMTVPSGSTCDAVHGTAFPFKAKLTMTLFAPDPKHPGKVKKVSSDKTDVQLVEEGNSDPPTFVVIGNFFSKSKTPAYTTQRAILEIVADQDQATVDNMCASNPKGLASLTFTGEIAPSTFELNP
jgi:concanavalin A-like lectin/glucanase superfamily protein